MKQHSAVGRIDALVIGAGHSGLAMSHCLTGCSVEHVVLERGAVANSWRKERRDSLRLLTPNWQSRLPGHQYTGTEQDGFMTMPEVIVFIDDYAELTDAPVRTGTTVTTVRAVDGGFRVLTDRGEWVVKTLVVASGACNVAKIPAVAEAIPPGLEQVTASDYRNPDQLAEGGVLVVGASATGLQLAEEIHASGRPVTIAVGEHVRLPWNYRGRDIQHWMDVAGVLDERYDEVDDIVRARGVPSPQLVGTPDRTTLDLTTLTDQGVKLLGRLVGIRDGKAQFSGSLRNVCALADLKMNRLLKLIDEWIVESDQAGSSEPVERFEPTRVEGKLPLGMDMENGEIRTVVWATGFRPDYSWLDVPVLDRKGHIRHDGGVTEAPGMYLLGLPFLRRRKSSFIHGTGDDASDLCAHLTAYLRDEFDHRDS